MKTIIFQCSKIYGNPTRVTSLKFATNMAIPISPNEKDLNVRWVIMSFLYDTRVDYVVSVRYGLIMSLLYDTRVDYVVPVRYTG